jgi:WD40 repeat protein
MAQQTEPVKRLVALKLIKAGMDSKQVIARFEAERQALALMDHANIARVLDGGTTGSGRPYFVMDLVKGVPITRYCDEHHLTPRQRLELFVPVCQAIQHAHQKGIIHRDLKPSNVLVALYDGKPVPKVIDFGVAKAAGQALTDKTLVTGFGNIVGTLEYMSPEQAEINQLDIDTRSDIYSLGVLLYELLTGSPPFTRKELENAGMLEMLRVIREQEPSKPSTKLSTAEGLPTLAANRGTEPAKLTKLVRGELDWIVMKALEKDRSRRYETANGFAMDVQRYLADEPVTAGPPSARYRLKKFLRRNRGPVLAAMLVILALIGGIIGTTLGLWRAEEEARNAGGERDRANDARLEERKAKNAESAQRNLAVKRGEERRQSLYFAEMNLAAQATESPLGFARVAELLAHWRSDQPDLRGWEWYYLFGLCHRDLLTISVSSEAVTSVAWNGDGTRLATTSSLTAVPKVWDAVTGKEAVILAGSRQGKVQESDFSVAWSPDCTLLASGTPSGHDKAIITIWDAVTGKQRRAFQETDGPITAVAWSPDGSRLAAVAGAVFVWDARTGKDPLILRGHKVAATVVAWNHDGTRLASTDQARDVKIWDTATWKVAGEIQLPQGYLVEGASWSPDGIRLALADQGGHIIVWDTATAKQQLLLNTFGGMGRGCVSWSPNGIRLAAGANDGQIKIWDPTTGKLTGTLRGHSDRIRSVAWSPDSTRLASASDDGTVRVWDAEPKDEPLPLVHKGRLAAASWSPNSKLLASASGYTVKIWDVVTGDEVLTFNKHSSYFGAVSWSPDGTRLASASWDRDPTVRIWDATTGKESLNLKGSGCSGASLAWSSDSTRLATVGTGGVVTIWDSVSGKTIRTFTASAEVKSVSFSPDGTRLASASLDGGVRIWDVATGEPTCTLKGHATAAQSVSWCPAGTRLASASLDRTVKIWDTTTGTEVLTLKGHTSRVWSVAWHKDGTRLATSSHDGTVKIWDAATGNETITLKGAYDMVVAWSPDGLRLAASASPASVMIFDASKGYQLGGRFPRVTRTIRRQPQVL